MDDLEYANFFDSYISEFQHYDADTDFLLNDAEMKQMFEGNFLN